MALTMEPLYELQRDFNRLAGGGARGFVPPADLLETDDEVLLYMDVPGLDADSLEIELENNVLTVRGERRPPEDARNWQRLERGFGRFERSVHVRSGLEAENIEASVADGVLTLRLRKPERLKPRRVEITSGRAEEERHLESAAA